jgi:hypothetical protein
MYADAVSAPGRMSITITALLDCYHDGPAALAAGFVTCGCSAGACTNPAAPRLWRVPCVRAV